MSIRDRSGSAVGPYILEGELGRGGMGVVYRARHKLLKRIVALKVLVPDRKDDDSLVRRFDREGRGGARLEHPRLVRVFDAGVQDGLPYLAMEYIDGQPLSRLLERCGRLPWTMVLGVASQLLEGLAHLHALEMVHRDVKPGNILIAKNGALKLGDYGLLRWKDATVLTAQGVWIGSALYMAPELFTNGMAGPASDLWAVGVTLYVALTGQPHVESEPMVRFLINLTEARIPPPSELVEVPAKVSELVMSLLDRTARRPTDAAAIKQQVDELLHELCGTRAERVLTEESVKQLESGSPRAATRNVTRRKARRWSVFPLLVGVVMLGVVAWALVHRPVSQVLSSPSAGASVSWQPRWGEAPAALALRWTQSSPLVAEGDVDGDGIADLVRGSPPTWKASVTVYSGQTGSPIRTIDPFPGFEGGVRVACGDVDSDGHADIIAGPGPGIPTSVAIYSGRDGHLMERVHPYDHWAGGVFVATARRARTGPSLVVTGAGMGGGPHVRIYSVAPTQVVHELFTFEPEIRRGVVVRCVDVDGDGADDLVATTEVMTPPVPRGRVFDGRSFAWCYSFAWGPQRIFDYWQACARRARDLGDPKRAGVAVRLLRQEIPLDLGEQHERWLLWARLGRGLTTEGPVLPKAVWKHAPDPVDLQFVERALSTLEKNQGVDRFLLGSSLDLIEHATSDARGWLVLGLALEADRCVEEARAAFRQAYKLLPFKCWDRVPGHVWSGLAQATTLCPELDFSKHWGRWKAQGTNLAPLMRALAVKRNAAPR